jgi:hypothetical protein
MTTFDYYAGKFLENHDVIEDNSLNIEEKSFLSSIRSNAKYLFENKNKLVDLFIDEPPDNIQAFLSTNFEKSGKYFTHHYYDPLRISIKTQHVITIRKHKDYYTIMVYRITPIGRTKINNSLRIYTSFGYYYSFDRDSNVTISTTSKRMNAVISLMSKMNYYIYKNNQIGISKVLILMDFINALAQHNDALVEGFIKPISNATGKRMRDDTFEKIMESAQEISKNEGMNFDFMTRKNDTIEISKTEEPAGVGLNDIILKTPPSINVDTSPVKNPGNDDDAVHDITNNKDYGPEVQNPEDLNPEETKGGKRKTKKHRKRKTKKHQKRKPKKHQKRKTKK